MFMGQGIFSIVLCLILFTHVLSCGSSTTPVSPSENASTPASNPNNTTQNFEISLNSEAWLEVYKGEGQIVFEESDILLEPKASTQANETHAALVLAKLTEKCPIQNFILNINASTVSQLRSPTPNAWEVFWIFFNYRTTSHGKETNYFILKPNGIELGKAFAELGQTFLYTDSNPILHIGETYHYKIEKRENEVWVYINDVLALDPQGQENDAIYLHPGSIGLYTEDAKVKIYSVNLEVLDSPLPSCYVP